MLPGDSLHGRQRRANILGQSKAQEDLDEGNAYHRYLLAYFLNVDVVVDSLGEQRSPETYPEGSYQLTTIPSPLIFNWS